MYKFFLLLLYTASISSTLEVSTYKPNSYTKEGYCIVKRQLLRYIGLTVFKNKKEFNQICKGKMFFLYKTNKCRWFTMKNMKFNIYIRHNNKKELFKIGERKEVCGNKIIEEI